MATNQVPRKMMTKGPGRGRADETLGFVLREDEAFGRSLLFGRWIQFPSIMPYY